jgi:hypothetical protein
MEVAIYAPANRVTVSMLVKHGTPAPRHCANTWSKTQSIGGDTRHVREYRHLPTTRRNRSAREGCRARARPVSEHRSGHSCCRPLIEQLVKTSTSLVGYRSDSRGDAGHGHRPNSPYCVIARSLFSCAMTAPFRRTGSRPLRVLFRNMGCRLSIGTRKIGPEITLVICAKLKLGHRRRRYERQKFVRGVVVLAP